MVGGVAVAALLVGGSFCGVTGECHHFVWCRLRCAPCSRASLSGCPPGGCPSSACDANTRPQLGHDACLNRSATLWARFWRNHHTPPDAPATFPAAFSHTASLLYTSARDRTYVNAKEPYQLHYSVQ